MLHRLDDFCILKRSDASQILHALSIDGHGDLANILNNAIGTSLNGWVAVPHVAEKKQLYGNTREPISLGRWQAILALSPEIPASNW